MRTLKLATATILAALTLTACSNGFPSSDPTPTVTETATETVTTTAAPTHSMTETSAIGTCQVEIINQLDRPNNERGEFHNIEATSHDWGWGVTMDLEFLGETMPVGCMVDLSSGRSKVTAAINR